MGCGPCAERRKSGPQFEQGPQDPMSSYKPTGQPDIACGITTAPRKIPTLTRCLTSVCANDILPTLYMEPYTTQEGVEKWVPRVYRERQLGCFYNWERMTASLILTGKPYILTLQDDCELSPVALQMARRFMEDWPDDCCMLSLYTPPWYQLEDGTGFSPVDQSEHPTRKLMGAVAWLFKRETLIRIRNTQDVCGTPKAKALEAKAAAIAAAEGRENKIIAGWRGNHNKELVDRLDIALGRGLLQCGLKEYVHTPSLSQHIAETSTLGHPPASMKGVHAESVLMELP